MVPNFKLFFKYVLFKINYSFVNNLSQKSKNINLCVRNSTLFLTCTHMKMSTSFYSTQLCDMFAYEILASSYRNHLTNGNFVNSTSVNYTNTDKLKSTIIVYNFHSLYSQNRFFIFTQSTPNTTKLRLISKNDSSDSIAELFPSANWLEREISELHGISFFGKKDLRNLMLQYGDSTAPFQKFFPSIGVKELFYSPIKDTLIQNHISVQL